MKHILIYKWLTEKFITLKTLIISLCKNGHFSYKNTGKCWNSLNKLDLTYLFSTKYLDLLFVENIL